ETNDLVGAVLEQEHLAQEGEYGPVHERISPLGGVERRAYVRLVVRLTGAVGSHVAAVHGEGEQRLFDRTKERRKREVARSPLAVRDSLEQVSEHVNFARYGAPDDCPFGRVDG